MDEHQVERAVILPLVSPESAGYLQPTDRALAAAKAHPDRLIPFCCIDARTSYGTAGSLRRMLEEYIGQGAKGFGEHKVGLPFNHPRMMEVYAACSEVKLPLLFHIDTQRGTDEPGMPNLENALKEFPQLKFIGHGPGFWGAISGEVSVVGKREDGPIKPGGALDRLMDKYPNLYGDLSAGSGARAMSRDPEFSRKFVLRWKNRLLFGTDYLRPDQDIPQFGIFDSMALPEDVQEKVFRRNAIELLKLG
jgi:predicted TIM-barrel fold metal-dependent hydrolase